MRPRYKVSQAGVDLIEAFEGFRSRSARLNDGGWTIGYGHTRSAREGAEISREDALMLLRWVDLPPVETAINELVSFPLAQNQYDALVAFIFNVGVDAFRESDVLERLNEGRLTEAACALELWRKADIAGDPVVLDALIRRRAAEKALFLAPGEGAAPTPSPLVRPRPDVRAAQFLPAHRPAEIEAPLSGERAEVRLVVPYEVEPDLEAATAFAPMTVEPEPVPEPALELELETDGKAAPTAWTAAAAGPEAQETLADAAAPVAETTAEPMLDEAAPSASSAEAAEPEPAAEDVAAQVEALTALTAWVAEAAEGEAVSSEPVIAPAPAVMAWAIQAPEQPASEQPAPETAEAAATASAEEVVDEAAPTPALAPWTVETSEAPAEELVQAAPSAWAAAAVESAGFEPAPTAWSIELPHAASVAPQEPTPAAWTAAPAETDWDEPAPSSWIVGETRPSESAPAASEADLSAAEPTAEAESIAESVADAAAEAEAPAAVDEAASEGPKPGENVRDIPAVGSALQMRALPEAAPRARPLYSSYGPMAFAVARSAPAADDTGEGDVTAPPPSEPQPVAEPQSAQAQPADPEPVLAQLAQAQPVQAQPALAQWFQRQPHFQPLPGISAREIAPEAAPPAPSFAQPTPSFASPGLGFAPSPPVNALAAAAAPAPLADPAPATPDPAPAKPLILTAPPADWGETRTASTAAAIPAAETDELETPLFDEGWDGPGALSGRIVHHEAPAEHDARASKFGVTGPYVLLGLVGFVAFGGALFAFSRGHMQVSGLGDPVVLAWILALIGAACVGISAYFLLRRLSGQED